MTSPFDQPRRRPAVPGPRHEVAVLAATGSASLAWLFVARLPGAHLSVRTGSGIQIIGFLDVIAATFVSASAGVAALRVLERLATSGVECSTARARGLAGTAAKRRRQAHAAGAAATSSHHHGSPHADTFRDHHGPVEVLRDGPVENAHDTMVALAAIRTVHKGEPHAPAGVSIVRAGRGPYACSGIMLVPSPQARR